MSTDPLRNARLSRAAKVARLQPGAQGRGLTPTTARIARTAAGILRTSHKGAERFIRQELATFHEQLALEGFILDENQKRFDLHHIALESWRRYGGKVSP